MKINQGRKLQKGFQFMNQNTINQREEYYSEYVNFKKNKLKEDLEKEYAMNNYSIAAQNYRHALKVKQKINLYTLKWLKNSEEVFNAKLMKCVDKLLKFGFLESNIMLTAYDISECHNRGLDFYIKAWNTEKNEYAGRVHARLIWVECYEKESHWRFVTTLKK